jgi:DMSO/TMAO reductase YedYZ molybdopterin-dependent catalytic subunit
MLSAGEPVLKVIAPEKTIAFSAEAFSALPHTDCTALEPHGQKQHRYTGVAVRELLVRAGVPLGDKLRGAAFQLVVLARARDGYAVVFTLADFDEAFNDRTILLAATEDGKPLPESAAPFRLVVPGDKRAARWVRMVTRLKIVAASSESSGTSNALRLGRRM